MFTANYITRPSDYRGFLTVVLLKAPDNLAVDHRAPEDQLTLEIAFKVLKEKLPVVKSRVKSDETMRIIREPLDISHEAFVAQDRKEACYALQEVMGLIWPSYAMEPKHQINAVRRLAART
jgi:hypothetical protein